MKKILSLFLSAITVCLTFGTCASAEEASYFEAVTYPDEALTEYNAGILDRVSSGDDYESNKGYDETGLYVSAYWNCEINGSEVPAYGILTYDFVLDTGVIHSFSRVKVKNIESGISVILKSIDINVINAVVLPEMYGIGCSVSGNAVSFEINKCGAYTVLINDDDQRYAFTLFADEYSDEDEEINELADKYGSDRVLVIDKGFYETEYIDTENYDAVYFRAGSYVKAKHVYDVGSDEDVAALPERKGFFSVSGKGNFNIEGSGVLDLTSLDRRERDSMFVSGCSNTAIEGLTFINSPTWTLFTYACDNLSLENITIFGYRTNSDGINVCGCSNVNVSDCYIRNGDDCCSVKTTNKDYTCHDVIFDNCIAYSTKARCFGLTGEAMADVYNITFRNSAVIYRDATWDNDRVSSIAVSIEYGGGNVSNITFENIEIHKDTGRAVNIIVYGDDVKDCKLTGIKLKNITCDSDMKSQIISKKDMSFIDYINSFFYRLIMKINPGSELTEYFASECGGNEISVSADNVDTSFIIRGNVNLT